MSEKTLAILGAGPGGYVAAVRAAQLGCKVTVVERESLGGVCLRHGCIPVKALLYSARVYRTAVTGESFGVTCQNPGIDFNHMIQRKDDIVSLNEQGIEVLFRKHGISLVRGSGRLVSPSRILVEDSAGGSTSVDADAVIIATGSSSIVPSFAKPDKGRVFDCEGALALERLPESCTILGGGVLGCEFASLFADLGVKVTLVEMLPTLLPTWDRDQSKLLTRSFKKRRIDVRTGTAVEGISSNGDRDGVTVTLSSGSVIDADTCLLALGRKPNIENIGLEEAGVTLWKDTFRGIEVDEFMRTSTPNVYAVGDITGIRPLAHIASEQGITAVEHICGRADPMRYDAVPDCYWASPELGSVGVTEQEAEARGLDVETGMFHYRSMGISHALGATEGFAKAIVEKGSGRIIGIHICGYGAPDLVAEASVIVTNGLTVDDIKHTIHAHPTLGEIVKEAVLAARGENIHG